MPDQSAQVTSEEFLKRYPPEKKVRGVRVEVQPLVEDSAEKGILEFSSVGVAIETTDSHDPYHTPNLVREPTHGLLLSRDTAIELVHKLVSLFPEEDLKGFARQYARLVQKL